MYSFDESLNEATQSCEIDLYVRYWDSCNNETKLAIGDLVFWAMEDINIC